MKNSVFQRILDFKFESLNYCSSYGIDMFEPNCSVIKEGISWKFEHIVFCQSRLMLVHVSTIHDVRFNPKLKML